MYKLTLLEKKFIAQSTMLFSFNKPDGFSYTAGQYVTLYLDKEEDLKKNWRYFSLCSAPYEKKLMMATRLTDSDFKHKLERLLVGQNVFCSEPDGNFILPENTSMPVVFLAGGIGITPVRSMVFEVLRKQIPYNLYLFYSNRRPVDTPFFQEFANINDPILTYIPTMTSLDNTDKNWDGQTGYIDYKLIIDYIDNVLDCRFYIVGSPGFVKAMNDMLYKHNISVNNIVFEEFLGY
jgi:ferredoxin-NADP reductase